MPWTAGVGIDLSGRRRSPAPPPGSAAETLPLATPRAAEPIEIWRAYASKLTTDVDVALAGGAHFTGTLVAVDDTGIDVRPDTRVVEPARRIPFAALEQLALRWAHALARVSIETIERSEDHVRFGKYVGVGGGIGAAVFLMLLAGG